MGDFTSKIKDRLYGRLRRAFARARMSGSGNEFRSRSDMPGFTHALRTKNLEIRRCVLPEPSGINRIYRLYREEGLAVHKRRARRRAMGTRAPIPVEARPNARWSLDFVHD